MPDVPPDVNQYQAHTLKCARCGKQVQALNPPQYSFGPNLQAFMTMQMVENHLPVRKACDLVGYFKVKISPGSVCNLRKRAAALPKNTAEKIRSLHNLPENLSPINEPRNTIKIKKCGFI